MPHFVSRTLLLPATRSSIDLRSRIQNRAWSARRLVFLGSTGRHLALIRRRCLFWRARRRFASLSFIRAASIRTRLLWIAICPDRWHRQDGGQKNDIVIRDVEHMISRFHCEVRKKMATSSLSIPNSSNGTSVNESPLCPKANSSPQRIEDRSRGSTVLQST